MLIIPEAIGFQNLKVYYDLMERHPRTWSILEDTQYQLHLDGCMMYMPSWNKDGQFGPETIYTVPIRIRYNLNAPGSLDTFNNHITLTPTTQLLYI